LTSIIFASSFTLLGWLATPGEAATYLQRFATALFLLALPLLIFGAHCLDLQDIKTHPPLARAASPPTKPHAHNSHRTANPPRTSQPPPRRGE
jgi:hypothetical protein